MNFNKLSTGLALSLLALITIILYCFCYLVLFLSIKKSLSKTQYFLNNEGIEIKTEDLNEQQNINS